MSNELITYENNDAVLEEKKDENINKDLQEVRNNIKNMIDGGSLVLDHLKVNALSSDEADYFDLYTKLLKVMLDANGKYMENINERKKDGEGSTNPARGGDTHNTLIVAESSTQDVIDQIINRKK